jgi:hypothetical protein
MLSLAVPTWAGHESPFDPSYYPHEIHIDAMTPAAAAGPLARATIQAYAGGDPYGGRTPPKDVAVVESLDAYVVLTANVGRLKGRTARCSALRRAGALLEARHGRFVFAPYPVTPYHADYLDHADLAAAARADAEAQTGPAGGGLVLAAGDATAAALAGLPPSAPPKAGAGTRAAWDVRIDTVSLRDLLAAHAERFAGWTGPPWLRDGWYDAYLLMAGTVADPAARTAVDQVYTRLVSGGPRGELEALNLERRLVSLLRADCGRAVAGYTVRREYYSSAYSPGIENVGFDAYDGFDSEIFLRTAKLKDFPWNGVLRIGVAGPAASPWNPVAGFGDPLGRLVWGAVGDTAMLPNPHGAGWIANRIGSWETWSVKSQRAFGGTGLSDAAKHELDIPADALVPRPDGSGFARAEAGRRAADMVEYRVLASAFHDGTVMSAGDLLYPFAFAYRWGGAGAAGRTADPAVGRETALVRRYLAGLKIVRVDKVVRDLGADLKIRYDVPIVRVYLSYPGADASTPLLAMPWSTVPWHVLALVDEAARRGIGALSPEAAAARGIPALDLVRAPAQEARLARLVDEFAAAAYMPEALRGIVTPQEARARWRALAAFYRQHRHFLVTNGPYRLDRWTAAGATLGVFRDLSYPLGVGSFDKEVYPRRAALGTIAIRGGRLQFRPAVERLFKYDRYYKMVTEPLGSNTSGAYDDITAVCRYVVVGRGGEAVKVAAVTAPDGGTFSFDPLEGLRGGDYTVWLAVAVNDNLINPEVRRIIIRR